MEWYGIPSPDTEGETQNSELRKGLYAPALAPVDCLHKENGLFFFRARSSDFLWGDTRGRGHRSVSPASEGSAVRGSRSI